MDATRLLVLSVLLFALGALASLSLLSLGRLARLVSGAVGMLASLIGLAAAFVAVFGSAAPISIRSLIPFGEFSLRIDSLSALLISMISLVAFAVSLYSLTYGLHLPEQRFGMLGFLTNLFVAVMLLVVTVSNAFYFLIFWEMMTLISYFLVTFEDRQPGAVRAGYLYMLVAQAGGTLIMLAFLMYYVSAGSFDFDSLRQAQLSPVLRDVLFLLLFAGFAAKAGVAPMHFWMPAAYKAAPSTASALMASVMKKTAIYGLLRFCVDLLGASTLWWGLLVLFFGLLSIIVGTLFALSERDLKKVLAYSSVENVGIILLGVGTGMIGLAAGQPVIVLLGFLAALYHALNHSFFKALLFLGAGAVEERLETSNLNAMGGLARRMPWTALGFLVGGMALSAIPPFNGFVSEWFTYQALFSGSQVGIFAVRVSLPLCAAGLALGGTLAAMIAIKAYSGAFSGPARNVKAEGVSEASDTMLASMLLLAAICLLYGLGAPWVVPWLGSVVSSVFHLPALGAATATWVYPVDPNQALLSIPLVALLLVGLLVVPFLLVGLYGGRKAGRRLVEDPWSCGYGYSPAMSVSAGSFDQPVKATFGSIYFLRSILVKPIQALGAWGVRQPRAVIARLEPVIENGIRIPAITVMDFLSHQVQSLQMGDIRAYCFYIIITLAILLVVIFR